MRRTAVIGVGQTPYRRRHAASTDDLVFRACSEALDDAHVTAEALDATVVGLSPDVLAGHNAMDKSFIEAAHGVGRPYLRVNTGGSTGAAAAHAAIDLVQSGGADVVLVVAIERMGQAQNAARGFNTIFDPLFEKDVALSTLTMGGLRATRLMIRYGYTPQLWARIAVRNFSHAARNPLAQIAPRISVEDVLSSPLIVWPIRRYDACPVSEGACAVVIAAADAIPPAAVPAWIAGRGARSDTYYMGDRMGRPEGDLVDLAALRLATDQAYAQAGITDPHRDVDVFEIHAPWSNMETMAYAPLRICAAEDGPDLVAGDFGAWGSSTVVNPSGGAQAANPVSATALVRIAEAALQVRGRAGARQVAGCQVAVATASGGTGQFANCTVLRAS